MRCFRITGIAAKQCGTYRHAHIMRGELCCPVEPSCAAAGCRDMVNTMMSRSYPVRFSRRPQPEGVPSLRYRGRHRTDYDMGRTGYGAEQGKMAEIPPEAMS